MKVLQIAPGYTDIPPRYGGAVEKHIIGLSDALMHLGVDVTIVARRSKRKRDDIIYLDPVTGDGSILHKVINSTIYSINLKHLVQANKFDIIHIHGGIAGLLQSITLSKTRNKLILTVHNTHVLSYNSLNRALSVLIETISATYADVIIAVSRAIKEILESRLKNKKVIYIPNGVYIKETKITKNEARQRLGLNADKIILFVGRFAPEKGIHVLIQALHEIIYNYGEKDIELVLIGPPSTGFTEKPSKYFRDIMNKVKSLKLDKHIVYLGRVSDHVLEEAYIACDVFVLPSIVEAMGMVLLEAMSYGRPVVASKTGGIQDIVDHMETGILVPPGNFELLAEALIKMLSDRKFMEKIALNAKNKVKREYNWTKIAEKIYTVYKELC